ncbi:MULTISPECIES: ATP-dependent helicase [unclassified Thermotoga]|uniref:ATP-dependent helicase n=1 Tax=unclassified Thermotoga TaxID=2631113 RepID=UPI000540A9FA|nr:MULTISPECIES: ATP-dependent helicase [unclassified Thermotoga]AIY88826.1 UvrD/REP helicase [Thermotoga sp. Cell2]KHC92994.1 UvrD/REP helicase [Thermotoga sp. TBGT1765]KHC94402.1 UvrD/REP helicase [Thermotoga sp. TBGT1766]KHC95658.1 UvrD/REP helicase [Thermotoga sp. Xyl54]
MKEYRIRPKEANLSFLEDLDEEQRKAVVESEGRCIVIAGPGSGKTRVITYKIAYLLANGVDPSRILLVTFTRAAAREMVERAKTVTGRELSEMLAGTFHHVCNYFLRKYAPYVGLERNYSILDREDAESLMRHARSKYLERKSKEERKNFPQPSVLMAIYSYMKNTLKSLRESIVVKNPKFLDLKEEISEIFDLYEQEKRSQNVVDYEDLLFYAYRLLEENKEIRDREAERFLWVLVDEFQDTNYVQYRIVEHLSSKHGNVLAVGDDAQSIYSFRGARYENVEDFIKVSGTKIFKIQTNYRSTESIVKFINAMLPKKSVPKELKPVKKDGMKPVVVKTWNRYEEARFVSQRILELIEEGFKPEEIAVLYRSHSHSLELQMELVRSRIDFRVLSGPRFTESAHVKDVLSFLRIVQNPRDKSAWLRTAKLFYGIGDRTASKIADLASAYVEEGLDPFQELKKVSFSGEYSRFIDILDQIRKLDSPGEMIERVLSSFYSEYLEARYPDFREREMDLERLVEIASRYTSLESFLTDLAVTENVEIEREISQKEGKVTLTTVHQAKGLEWRVVFVISVNPGDFPNYFAISEGNLDEEERIFYVAITRAKEQLYISYQVTGTSYPYRGNRFIMRSGENFIDRIPLELVEFWEVK